MKRYSISGLTAILGFALVFAACERLEPVNIPTSGGALRVENVPVRLEGAPGTKVAISDEDGYASWTAGDQVAYCVTSGSGYLYRTADVNVDDAVIPMSFGEGESRANYVIYPASAVPESPTAADFQTPTVVYPASYDIAGKDADYAPCPMVAVNGTNGLDFYHVGALVRLEVSGIPANTTSLQVVFLGAAYVTGNFAVANAGSENATCSHVSGGGNVVTFTNGGSAFSTSDPVILNVPVPAGTQENLRSVMVRCMNGATVNDRMEISVSWRKFPRRWGRVAAISAADRGHVFSVAADKKVVFAPGNLQAVMSSAAPTNTHNYTASSWKFAEEQWSSIGNAAGNTSFAAGSTVDFFGWVGNSASYNTYGLCTDNTNPTSATYYGGNTADKLKTDWGAIPEVVSNLGSGWFTLSNDQWGYLFNTRTNTTVNGVANARYTRATINMSAVSADATTSGVHGMILFPDNFVLPDGIASEVVWGSGINSTADFNSNGGWNAFAKISSAGWEMLEEAGCVFLPTAGYRSGTSVHYAGLLGYYWSSSPYSAATNAYLVSFGAGGVNPQNSHYRFSGFSVRLARES